MEVKKDMDKLDKIVSRLYNEEWDNMTPEQKMLIDCFHSEIKERTNPNTKQP